MDINIRYEVLGKVDGLWTIQAFDRHDNKLGAMVTCRLPSEAWRVFFMLNGMGDPSPEVLTEDTTEIAYVEVA
jgi:hypothetical protein